MWGCPISYTLKTCQNLPSKPVRGEEISAHHTLSIVSIRSPDGHDK